MHTHILFLSESPFSLYPTRRARTTEKWARGTPAARMPTFTSPRVSIAVTTSSSPILSLLLRAPIMIHTRPIASSVRRPFYTSTSLFAALYARSFARFSLFILDLSPMNFHESCSLWSVGFFSRSGFFKGVACVVCDVVVYERFADTFTGEMRGFWGMVRARVCWLNIFVGEWMRWVRWKLVGGMMGVMFDEAMLICPCVAIHRMEHSFSNDMIIFMCRIISLTSTYIRKRRNYYFDVSI